MIPKWLWVTVFLGVIIPYGFYQILTDENKVIATLLGLFLFTVLFPVVLFIYVGNKKNEMISKKSHLWASSKSKIKFIDLSIRIFFALLGVCILGYDGIPLLKDFLFLTKDEPIQLEAKIIEKTTPWLGTLVSFQIFTVVKPGGEEERITKTS